MTGDQTSLKVAIIGGTFSGNKGAASMLKSVIKNLPITVKLYLNFDVLSVYPQQDAHQNIFSNAKIVSCKPEEIVFIAFPLAILYKYFSFIPAIKKLLLKNKILLSLKQARLIVDIAGVSFVDGRGFIMTMYNYICSFVPLAVNENVIKLSQATGPYKNFFNRVLARAVLSKLKLICPRGKVTHENLDELGLTNHKLCADLAFILPDDLESQEEIKKIFADLKIKHQPLICVSISSVVDKYCKKHDMDYTGVMADFIDWLIKEKNYAVIIIAQSAREGKTGAKNNDLLVCREVYLKINYKHGCVNLDKELPPETLREIIAKSEILVASRFHAMVSALYKKVPILLIGWSHKYQEVLDMFKLGRFAIDYKKLSLKELKASFELVEKDRDSIKFNIEKYLPEVQDSARENFNIAAKFLNKGQL